MRRPILNHLRRGELVYDPFLGSGTLEERSDVVSSKPRKVLRILVTCLGREPGLENAECR
jgi:hypothetical protein